MNYDDEAGGGGVTPHFEIIVGDWRASSGSPKRRGSHPIPNSWCEIETTVQVIWFRYLISFWGGTVGPPSPYVHLYYEERGGGGSHLILGSGSIWRISKLSIWRIGQIRQSGDFLTGVKVATQPNQTKWRIFWRVGATSKVISFFLFFQGRWGRWV